VTPAKGSKTGARQDLSKAVPAQTTVQMNQNQFALMTIARAQKIISARLDHHRNAFARMRARPRMICHNVQTKPARETQTKIVLLETTKVVNARRTVQHNRLRCQFAMTKIIVLGRRTRLETGHASK
jgi:hypothetical protein